MFCLRIFFFKILEVAGASRCIGFESFLGILEALRVSGCPCHQGVLESFELVWGTEPLWKHLEHTSLSIPIFLVLRKTILRLLSVISHPYWSDILSFRLFHRCRKVDEYLHLCHFNVVYYVLHAILSSCLHNISSIFAICYSYSWLFS